MAYVIKYCLTPFTTALTRSWSIALLLLLLITTNAFTQPTLEWVRTYNSPDNLADHFTDMKVDRFGNIYLTGWNITQTQGNNISTVKYNSSGSLLWSAWYNSAAGISVDLVNSMAVDSSGNCYVAGYYGYNFGPYDGVLIKYNSFGDTAWTRKLITSLDDEFGYIAIDPLNYIYVSGRSGDSAVVFKFDSLGNVVWRTRYFEPQYLCLPGIIKLDKFNNVYIGSTKHNLQNPLSPDFLIRKYNQNGTLLWGAIYDDPLNRNDWLSDIFVDINGNCFSTGSAGINGSDLVTVKHNSNGQLQWANLYNGQSNASDQGYAIIGDPFGNNIFVTGYSFNTGASRDYITIKYTADGDTLWVKSYNGIGNYTDVAHDISIDSLNNVYITGSSSANGLDFDVVTLKYTTNGNVVWLMRWGGQANSEDGGYIIVVDNLLNVFVSGGVGMPEPNNIDFLTIKYSQLSSVNIISDEKPKNFLLSQNFPNPFNQTTLINYQLKERSFVELKIFDILGRHLITLFKGLQNAGSYQINFDASFLASGVYLYSLETENFKQSRIMVLNK